MQRTVWKLDSPPDTEVHVDEDVLAMRAPLVSVRRDRHGGWSFDGPRPRSSKRAMLGAVVGAWPHVVALSALRRGDAAVWSWKKHGWTGESTCDCGSCDEPIAADLDRASWPAELRPHYLVSVEQAALSGRVSLTDILSTADGIVLLGPGEHRRTSDMMTPVATANVIRRWPHTMQAFRSLAEGRAMRWNHEQLTWHEYLLT